MILQSVARFVSRSGEKLQAAVEDFGLDFRDAHVLDVGASTGGFTDCALAAGAAAVVAVPRSSLAVRGDGLHCAILSMRAE